MAVDTAPASPVAGGAAPGGAREPRRAFALPSGSVITTFLVLFLVIASVAVEGFASTRNAGFLLLDVAVIALIAYISLIIAGLTVDVRFFDFANALVMLLVGAAVGYADRHRVEVRGR